MVMHDLPFETGYFTRILKLTQALCLEIVKNMEEEILIPPRSFVHLYHNESRETLFEKMDKN